MGLAPLVWTQGPEQESSGHGGQLGPSRETGDSRNVGGQQAGGLRPLPQSRESGEPGREEVKCSPCSNGSPLSDYMNSKINVLITWYLA